MKAFRLYAEVSTFEGTDQAPGRKEILIAVSKDEAKLEALRDEMFGKNMSRYRINVDTPYIQYVQKRTWKDPKTFQLASGLTVPIVPWNDFYGAGSVDDIDIEEFDYVDPSEFI